MKNDSWHSKDIDEILIHLNTSINGLTREEARGRLEKYGENNLPKKKHESLFHILVNQFTNPLVYILVFTVILSFLIGEEIDALFILIVIILDIFLGTFQEWKAGRKSDSLQELIRVDAIVLRDNLNKKIRSNQIVVGDIVILDSGTKVSADLRLTNTKNLTIDESMLTGESTPSNKCSTIMLESTLVSDRENMAYAGTTVVTGRGIGVVVATGSDTEIGKIADKVTATRGAKPPLVIRMDKFTKQISYFMVIVAMFLTIVLYSKGYVVREILFAVIGLLVSAVPEGLSIALTLALSVASSRMAKKNVIVKKLNAVESLGSCTVVASDKTGTLTLNQQTAKKVLMPNEQTYNVEGAGYNDEGEIIGDGNIVDAANLAFLGAINNEATLIKKNGVWNSFGDSIDIAFLALAYKLGIDNNIEENIKVRGVIPYESENKYSAVFYEEDNKMYCTTKGSLEKVMEFCDTMMVNNKIVKIDKDLMVKQNNDLAGAGYRVIAIAKGMKKDFKAKNEYSNKDIPKLTMMGLVGFIDPIRKETIEAIKKCKNAGIKVIVITGDHPLTAFAIAKELGIVKTYKKVTNGDEINKYLNMGEQKFDNFIEEKTVFSRVSPLQKVEIIGSLKRQGEFVAVTGDGVNDTPAMRIANIGVAMGSGTDIAKETGTMIIVDDNFLSVVSGIEEGRIAYRNIRKVIYFLISAGLAEVLFFVLSIISNLPIPLVAVQLLWLNLVTDGIQDAALSFEKGESGIMNEKPRKPNEKIFNELLLQETLVSGLTIGIAVFIFWAYLINIRNMNIYIARSYVLLLMIFMQNIHVFNCRSEHASTFKIPLKNNPLIVVGVLLALLLQLFATQSPLFSSILQLSAIPANEVIIIFAMALPILVIMEIFKKIKEREVN